MLDVYFATRYLQLRDDVSDEGEDRSTATTLERLRTTDSLSEEDFAVLSGGYALLRSIDQPASPIQDSPHRDPTRRCTDDHQPRRARCSLRWSPPSQSAGSRRLLARSPLASQRHNRIHRSTRRSFSCIDPVHLESASTQPRVGGYSVLQFVAFQPHVG